MREVIKRMFLFVLLAATAVGAYAQKVTFEANVPEVVAVGEVFRLEYKSNAKVKDFVPPTFNGLDVLAGPTMSSSRSRTIINGSMTQTSQYIYTFVLQGNVQGEYVIPPVTIEADGKKHTAGPFTVKVMNDASAAQPANAQGEQRIIVAPDDVFIRAVVDKTDVYKGEAVKVSFKVYSRLPLILEGVRKLPSFNGFWSQELNTNQYQWQREAYNDKIYDSRTIVEYMVFPQQSGVLSIEPMELSAIVQIVGQQRRQTVLESLYGLSDTQEIRKVIATDPVDIKVKNLPAGAPESFNGAVGNFEMVTDVQPREVAANSAMTYSVKISGTGNLPQVQAPKLYLPTSFDQYNVKATESINNTTRGVYGYKQFEYPVIARAEGDYNIGSVEFTYFNPSLVKYETLQSPPVTLRILPDSTGADRLASNGIVSGLSKEEIKILGRDIRFIKLGSAHLKPHGFMLIGSAGYIGIVLLLLVVFVLLLKYLKRLLKERRNSAILKGKRANKVALQRFKSAEKYMREDNQRGFYEEMLKALWGYMGDKLNIPGANLTKDNIREGLMRKAVPTDVAESYVAIISECEYAQYGPSVSGKMHDIYTEGISLISKLESIIGK